MFDWDNRDQYDWCPACGTVPRVRCRDKRTIYPCPETGVVKARYIDWVHPSRLAGD